MNAKELWAARPYFPRAVPPAAGQAARVCPACGARGTVVQGKETHRGEFGNMALIVTLLTFGLAYLFLGFRKAYESKTWCTNCGTVFS